MISKTKYKISEGKIKELFAKAGITDISSINPLNAGEFNAVFEVKADRDYVLKIAPDSTAPTLTYEKDMMKCEVEWYKQIKNKTNIKVPEIYYSDFSKELIPTDFFIMEKLEGKHRNEIKSNPQTVIKKTAEMISQIHTITNDKFGYVQNGFYDNWYDAFCSMVKNLISDCERMGKSTKKGQLLLKYVKGYKDILENVPCSMVNYDLWDPNILCTTDSTGDIVYSWIDPERCFWGDYIFDFICLELCTSPLKNKTKSIEAYNLCGGKTVELNRNTEIRYAFAQCYMGLIQEVEKYYRYTPCHFGWWRNVLSASAMYSAGFKVLKKYA